MPNPCRLPVGAKLLGRPASVILTVNGNPILAYPGESLAAALLGAGFTIFRHTAKNAHPRAPVCNMGVCFECLVTIDGYSGQRSCLIPVQADMKVELDNG